MDDVFKIKKITERKGKDMHGKGFYSLRISQEQEEKAQEDIVMSLDIAGKSVNQRFIEDAVMSAISGINANIIDRRLDEAFSLDRDSEGVEKHESQY